MDLLRIGRWILLGLIAALIAFIPVFGQEESGFMPVQVGGDTDQEQVLIVRIIVNDQWAFFVEGRIIGGQPALPVLSTLRELHCKYQVENDCLSMKAIGSEKTVSLNFRNDHLTLDGLTMDVRGVRGDSDYYLSLLDFTYLLGSTPEWSAEDQDVKITVALSNEQENRGEDDSRTLEGARPPRPFQPFNRLDLYLTGQGDGFAYGHSPGWDYGDLSLEWRTYGTIWGGRLTLGGDLIWIIEPNEDWDSLFTVYRWDKDIPWGRLTVGTQPLSFRESFPELWEMRGISLTDGRYWDGAVRSTNIVGEVKLGAKAELWLGDWLINSTEITNGEYRFADIWLPTYKASQLVVVIKDDQQQVVERQSFQYIPGEKLFAAGDNHYILAIGQTKDDDREEYLGWATAGEWVRGWTEDLTAGGLLVINEDDQRQLGFNIAWRPQKNLIFHTEVWNEPSAYAWRLGSDWGYNRVYLQGRAYHRDLGFLPVFPSDELGSEVDLAQLALYWYPTDQWKGIFAGEYSTEKMGWEKEYTRFEASLNFRNASWQSTTYVMWKDENEDPGESLRQNCLASSLIWDFRPNQWLELGFEYNDYNYEFTNDEKTKDAWLRWTNQSRSQDRWMVGYVYFDNEMETEHSIESRWNHRWSDEWSTYTGIAYGWGEDGVDYQDWLWNCGLEYRMNNGVFLSFGYEWNVKKPDLGQDEYRQNLYLQVSMGVLFGSGSPSLIAYSGDHQTTGSISGLVYADLNANGHRDNGEPGIHGIRVRIDDLESAITDAEGRYVFYNVATGIHRLALDETTLPVAYNPSEHHRMVHIIAGSSLKEDLGLLVVGAVSGRVFIDHNGNGSFDEGETLLAGVRVQTENGDAWATTGKGGDYYIQLMAGEHKLVIDASTLPENVKAGTAKIVRVGENREEITGLDFAVEEGETKK